MSGKRVRESRNKGKKTLRKKSAWKRFGWLNVNDEQHWRRCKIQRKRRCSYCFFLLSLLKWMQYIPAVAISVKSLLPLFRTKHFTVLFTVRVLDHSSRCFFVSVRQVPCQIHSLHFSSITRNRKKNRRPKEG